MNKNPFIPQSNYAPQPPLPPGPPPPPPTGTDYSAYWAASAQQAGANAYNAQWTPSAQPPRPSAEQSALYANYGYGPQNQWQRQQQQQYHQPPQSVPAAGPPGYSPYQPAVGYTPYMPQVQALGYSMQQPQSVPIQPMFSAPMQQVQQQQMRPQQQHHPSPQHLPPAKRQRFDGPQNRQPPSQPHFQLPAAASQGVPFSGTSNRGGAPIAPSSSRGSLGRGGMANVRGGRGGMMGQNRGGPSGGRGRTGSAFISGGNRGGGALRGHNSRGNFGAAINRRGGGSFNMGSGNYQAGSFRGRGHAHSNRGARHDGAAGGLTVRDGSMSSSFASIGKKDENKRTLTDFRIVGLEIRELSWSWGILPVSPQDTIEKDLDIAKAPETRLGDEALPADEGAAVKPPEGDPTGGDDTEQTKDQDDADSVTTEPNMPTYSLAHTSSAGSILPETNELPSRIRIYFHTPVTAEDARPNPQSHPTVPATLTSSDSRKGKRKKLEDDDPDMEDGRSTHRLPPHSADDRDSASVAETVSSEQDWLMAAIVEGDDDQEHEDLSTQPLPSGASDAHEDDETATQIDPTDAEGVPNFSCVTVSSTSGLPLLEFSDPFTSEGIATDIEMNEDEEDSHDGVFIESVGIPAGGILTENHKDTQSSPPGDEICETSVVALIEPDTSLSSVVSLAEEAASLPHLSVSDVFLPKSAPHISLLFISSETQPADHIGPLDTQVLEESQSSQTTTEVLDSDAIPPGLVTDPAPSATNGPEDHSQSTSAVPEHLPEPPGSPAIQSAATSVASPLAESTTHPSPNPPAQAETGRTSSANRLSISYANSSRRLIVDADVVNSVKIFRAEARIEVSISTSLDGKDLKGIILEGLSDATHAYAALPPLEETTEHDSTLPSFGRTELPSTLTLVAYLDTSRPLSEAKWVKTGDIQDWLRSMLGRVFFVSKDAAEGWEKKITVEDPDPPPTIHNVVDSWAIHSLIGAQNERERFVKTHMTETDNLLEILLRLVRGERATSFASGPTISTPSVSGPLLSALTSDSAHGAHQTHVSLAVLAIFRLATEFAQKLDGDKGKIAVNESVGEIIRCIPSHLIYKSLDGIFKEWRTAKKGH